MVMDNMMAVLREVVMAMLEIVTEILRIGMIAVMTIDTDKVSYIGVMLIIVV